MAQLTDVLKIAKLRDLREAALRALDDAERELGKEEAWLAEIDRQISELESRD